MFKLENSPDSVDQELDTDLLEVDPSFNLEAVTNLFYNDPSIIECLSDTQNRQVSFPVSPIGPPDRYPLNNESQFVVQINSSDVRRKKYLYSHKLNRIYVDIETCFCIEFNWNQKMFTHSGPMYVRSAVVFSDMAQAQKRVEVCVQHFHTAKSAGKPDLEAKNVLLSARSGTDGVYYCGVPERPDSWLSVLVEFNKTSDEPCLHAYQFVCKNSCSTGINRRSIEIIFTLEDKSGKVFGRQTVGARVCACPNRDLCKDEKDAPAAGPPTKKRRCESARDLARHPAHLPAPQPAHEHLPLLPALPVVDKHILETGLLMILRMTEQAAADRSGDPQAVANCKKSIAAFEKYLADMKQPPS